MKLLTIKIENFRSVEDIVIDLDVLDDGTSTYGLIGVNEAGKSSLLKAIALQNGEISLIPKDFRDKGKSVVISMKYILSNEEKIKYLDHCLLTFPEIEKDVDKIDFGNLTFQYIYTLADLKPTFQVTTSAGQGKKGYTFKFAKLPFETPQRAIFWTADDKYLISNPINIASFAADPDGISVPLRNCFLLAGIADISTRISSLGGDSTEVEQLQFELGEAVTSHIKTVWPNHPIVITFYISDGLINFHVKDIGIPGKAKTADQRSDGFKQFVSFLLTVSAQNMNEELSNTILLLDEPETHLHPKAQEHLLGELCKITQNVRNNVVMFATHSNFMIDKSDLSRNFRIEKIQDKTIVTRLSKHSSTYASVNYEVFDISSTDYHNEIYARLHESYQDEVPDDKARSQILNFDTNYLHEIKGIKKNKPWKGNANQATICTYIRNCIHHPDNGDVYTQEDLEKSIQTMLAL